MDSQEKHGTIIHPDGKEDLFMFKGEVPRLKEIQKAIGGYIDVFYLSNGKILIFDEDFKSKGLPYNTHASLMAGGEIYGKAILIDHRLF